MAEEKNSIFDLADKFDVESPFKNNWVENDFKTNDVFRTLQQSPSVKLNPNSELGGNGFTNSDPDPRTGQVVKNGFMQADVAVSGVKALALRVVQVVYFKYREGKPSGKPITVNGKDYVAFVDGGHNSSDVRNRRGEIGDRTRPYLYGPTMRYQKSSFEKWNGNSGNIVMSDGPLAALDYSEMYFETYVVASRYNGKSQDRVLAKFSWGFKNYGRESTHGKSIPLKLTSSLSSTAKQIIKNDGYSYKTI